MKNPKRAEITPELREQIIALARENIPPSEIVKNFPELNVYQINGVLRMAKIDRIPSPGAKKIFVVDPKNPAQGIASLAQAVEQTAAPTSQPVSSATPTPPAAVVPPVPVVPSPTPVAVGRPAVPQGRRSHHQGGEIVPDLPWRAMDPAAAASGGLAFGAQATRIEVEREIPSDGYLDSHSLLTRDQLGRLYGSGTYVLTKYEAGKLPTYAKVVISEAFGPPKSPRRAGTAQSGRPTPEEVALAGNRSGGSGYPGSPTASSQIKEMVEATKDMFDFATRKTEAGGAPAASVASTLEKVVDRALTASQRPTDADWLKTWIAEENARRERQVKDQEEREAKHREDDDRRWQRYLDLQRESAVQAAKDAEERHRRDMERHDKEMDARLKIAADERKTLLDLEDRKTQVLNKQIEDREKAVEERLKENSKAIGQAQADIKEELAQERKHQEELFKLQKENLDQWHKFQTEKLDILRKQTESASTDSLLLNTLRDVIQKVDQRMGDAFETQKLQVILAEAEKRGISPQQLAGVIGNVVDDRTRSEAAPGAKPPGNGNGNGHSKTTEEGAMSIIDRFFSAPEFAEIVEEWALHVKEKCDTVSFTNTFLTWMQADNRPAMKEAATSFEFFMRPRPWAKMLEAMKVHLSKETLEVFSTPHAEKFYEGVRGAVHAVLKRHYAEILSETSSEAESESPPPARRIRPAARPEKEPQKT